MATPRSHLSVQTTWIAVMDLFCLIAGGTIGVVMRLGPAEMGIYVYEHIDGWLVFAGSIIMANYIAGSYRMQYTYSRFNLVVTWLFTLTVTLLVLSITSYAWFRLLLGRGVLVLSVAWYSFFSLFFKMLIYRSLFRSDIFLCRTVVLGTDRRAKSLREMMEDKFVLPAHKVVTYINLVEDGKDNTAGNSFTEGITVVNSTGDDLEDIVRSLGVNLVVIGLDNPREIAKLYPHLRRLRFEGIEVLTAQNVAEIYKGRTPLDMVNEDYLMQVSMESRLPFIRRSKRLLDIIMSVFALILFLPIGLLIAVLIKIGAPRSPVFYSQMRVGRFGDVFRIYKFRTMQSGAEDVSGPVWAEKNDSRITGIGRVLRRFRLDEIPQFLNILNGDMSIVGPRPERPEIAAELEKEISFYHERANILPGLTGWAQIRYPYGDSLQDAACKLEYDLYYIKNMSLSLDLQIILSTLRIVLFGMER
ncbi:exopolysaccharide biosynthesis polyprenyl glycosylphosphotransferase [Verrucomicrobiota bacterium]